MNRLEHWHRGIELARSASCVAYFIRSGKYSVMKEERGGVDTGVGIDSILNFFALPSKIHHLSILIWHPHATARLSGTLDIMKVKSSVDTIRVRTTALL
jgi:hypothetical protein